MKNWRGFSFLERGVVCVALMLSVGPILPSERAYVGGSGPEGQPVFQVAWIVLYLLGFIIALRHRAALWSSVRENAVVLAPVLVALASVWWSDAASLTTRRATALLLTSLFALTLAELLSLRDLFVVFSWVLAALLVVSLFVILAFPGYGLDHIRGDAWQGLFATKNELGRVAALSLAVWVLRFFALPRRTGALIVVGLSVVLLLESRSRTALVTAIVVLVFISLVPMLRAEPRRAVAGSMFGVAVFGSAIFWILTHEELVLSALKAAPTLTGRSQIWAASWLMARRHIWLGYGYSAFWLGAKGPSAIVASIVGSILPSAHNGVLEIWLELGAVGVAAATLAFLVLLRRSWLLLRRPGTVLNAWPMLFWLFVLMSNLTESAFLVENSMLWILTVALAAQATRRPAIAAVPESARLEGWTELAASG